MELMTKNNYFSKNMIVKLLKYKPLVFIKAFLLVILFILRFIKKNSPKVSKEKEVIHNKIQKQLLTILQNAINISIGYVLFRKYTMHD